MHIAVIYPSRMIFLKDILSTITVSVKKVKEVPERNSNSFWVTVAKYELRKKCEPNTKCTLRPIPAIMHNLKKNRFPYSFTYSFKVFPLPISITLVLFRPNFS